MAEWLTITVILEAYELVSNNHSFIYSFTYLFIYVLLTHSQLKYFDANNFSFGGGESIGVIKCWNCARKPSE